MLYDAQKANVLKGALLLSDITLVADSAARSLSFLLADCRNDLVHPKTRFGIENKTMQKNVILRINDNSTIKSVQQIKIDNNCGKSVSACSFCVA